MSVDPRSQMEYDLGSSYAHSRALSRDSKTISLSIDDLMTEPTAGGKTSANIEGESIDYKTELAKLLAKSRGTAYEKTLKRFVESKYREIQMDESERTRKALAGQLDLASLSTSKYDSPRKTSILEDSVLNSARKSKIEEMAKPLERNIWKGPENPVSLASTNLIGRQRPSPMKDAPYAIHTDSNSLLVTAHSTVVRTVSPERGNNSSSSAGISRTRRRQRSRSPQVAALSAAPAAPPAVSTGEFNQWLEQNRQWQLRAQNKIERERRRFEKKLAQAAVPRLHAKSHQMGAEANLRVNQSILDSIQQQNQQLQQQLWDSQQQQRSEPEDDLLSEFDLPLEGSLVAEECDDGQSSCASSSVAIMMPGVPPSAECLSVYDRLAARGRQHAEKRRNWQPPEDDQPHKPVILEASLRMIRNSSRSRSRVGSESPLRRTSSPSPNRKFLTGSGISKVLAASAAAAAPPASPSGSHFSYSNASNTSSSIPYAAAAKAARHDSRSTQQSATSETVHSFVVTSSSLRLSDLLAAETNAATDATTDVAGGVRQGRSRERSPSTSSTTTGSVYGGTSSLQRGDSSTAGSRSRSRSSSAAALRLLAASGIERSRSVSESRRQRERSSRERREYRTTTATAAAPFTPLMVSSATSNRLLARSSSGTPASFTERNLRSVETRFIRNVISKRAGSPGPGYYSNISSSSAVSPSRVRSCSSPTTKGVLVVRDASPGHRGYSFNKEPLKRLNNTNNLQPGDGKVAELMTTLSELGSTWRMRHSSSRGGAAVGAAGPAAAVGTIDLGATLGTQGTTFGGSMMME